MKILLIAGHGNGDCGAVGCGYKEADLTREMVKLIQQKLKNYATVEIADTSKNWYQHICKNGSKFNFKAYDYVLEIHFNACVKDTKGNGVTTGTVNFLSCKETGFRFCIFTTMGAFDHKFCHNILRPSLCPKFTPYFTVYHFYFIKSLNFCSKFKVFFVYVFFIYIFFNLKFKEIYRRMDGAIDMASSFFICNRLQSDSNRYQQVKSKFIWFLLSAGNKNNYFLLYLICN